MRECFTIRGIARLSHTNTRGARIIMQFAIQRFIHIKQCIIYCCVAFVTSSDCDSNGNGKDCFGHTKEAINMKVFMKFSLISSATF